MSLAQMAEPYEGVQAPEPGEWKLDGPASGEGVVELVTPTSVTV